MSICVTEPSMHNENESRVIPKKTGLLALSLVDGVASFLSGLVGSLAGFVGGLVGRVLGLSAEVRVAGLVDEVSGFRLGLVLRHVSPGFELDNLKLTLAPITYS